MQADAERIEITEHVLESERVACESYNTRAMRLAGLSALTASVMIGIGTTYRLDGTTLWAILFGLSSCALFLAVLFSIICLWPRNSQDKGESRNEVMKALRSGESLSEAYLEALVEWAHQNADAVVVKRGWTKHAYTAFAIGIGLLAAQALVIAVDSL